MSMFGATRLFEDAREMRFAIALSNFEPLGPYTMQNQLSSRYLALLTLPSAGDGSVRGRVRFVANQLQPARVN
jgi:hypothetical protein